MRKIKVKRLVYSKDYGGHAYLAIGGETYDAHLTDDNILGSFRSDVWGWASSYGDCLVRYNGSNPVYMRVETFYEYRETWFDKMKKWLG